MINFKNVVKIKVRLARLIANQGGNQAEEIPDEALIELHQEMDVDQFLLHGYETIPELDALYDYGWSLSLNNNNGLYGPNRLREGISNIINDEIAYGPANKLPDHVLEVWEVINDGITSLLQTNISITTSDVIYLNNISISEVSMIDIATPVADIVDITAASILLGAAGLLITRGATSALLNDTISNVYSNMRSILEANNFYNTAPDIFKTSSSRCFLETKRITVRLYEEFIPQGSVEAESIGLAFRGDYIHYKSLINSNLEISYLVYRKMMAKEFGFIQNYPTLFDYDPSLTDQLCENYSEMEISEGINALFLEHHSIAEVHNAFEVLATTGFF